MNKTNTKKYTFVKIILATIVFFNSSTIISAEEITITENGASSVNEVKVDSAVSNEVEQTNSITIDNSINITLNTGDNTANDNTAGGTSIITGDATINLNLANSGNISTINTNVCCANATNQNIEGNGNGSENNIEANSAANEKILITQNAKINNTIFGYVNTGNNTSNDNSDGDIKITTGKIKVLEKIINSPINLTVLSTDVNAFKELYISIKANGDETSNTINNSNLRLNQYEIRNIADLSNYSTWYLNTGGNKAGDNTDGKVAIETGNIDFYSIINNFVNHNVVNSDCHCDEKEKGEDEEKEPVETKIHEHEKNNEQNKIPGVDVLKAGGPGILGLSDTSGTGFSGVLIFLGLAMTGGGSRILYGEARKIFKKK